MLPATVPCMEIEIRYSTDNNFVGEPISGYGANKALLSIEAAQALSKVQIQLTKKGMGLKIFDAYRPQKAVDILFVGLRTLKIMQKSSCIIQMLRSQTSLAKGILPNSPGILGDPPLISL